MESLSLNEIINVAEADSLEIQVGGHSRLLCCFCHCVLSLSHMRPSERLQGENQRVLVRIENKYIFQGFCSLVQKAALVCGTGHIIWHHFTDELPTSPFRLFTYVTTTKSVSSYRAEIWLKEVLNVF